MKYQTEIIPKENKSLRNNRWDKQQGDGFKSNHISKCTLSVNDLDNKIKM